MTLSTYSSERELWPAPVAAGPIAATVALPGSKSLTNRELILAALAARSGSSSTLVEPLESRDSSLMVEALKALGFAFSTNADGELEVTLDAEAPGRVEATIDCGLAGTVMRFVPPFAALATGRITFDGDEGARRRPMATTIDSLRALGVEVDDGGRGALPFTIVATGSVRGGELTIDASASSQFVSGLLLSAAAFDEGLTLRHVGEHLPSMPHIDMTVECLRQHGIEVSQPEPAVWRVEPGQVQGGRVVIEPDLSNAGPFLAAAMVAGGSVTIPHWPASTTQVGDEFDGILQRMGAEICRDDRGLTITGSGKITGIDIDLSIGGELTPVIAALGAIASTPTRITGVAHLRGHETDRLAALVAEINRVGGIARELEDGLEIDPSDNLHGGEWLSYEDHRMATAGAIIGLRVPGILVENIGTTSKTMPNFARLWQTMLEARA